MKHSIYFCQDKVKLDINENEEPKTSQASMGSLVPMHLWVKPNPYVFMCWVVKWTLQGLVPVCPMMCFVETVEIPLSLSSRRWWWRRRKSQRRKQRFLSLQMGFFHF